MCTHSCKDYIDQNKQYDAARIPSNSVTITSLPPYEMTNTQEVYYTEYNITMTE